MESSSVSDRVLNLLLDTFFSWLEVAYGVNWYSLRHPVFIGVHTLWNAWGWGKGGIGECKGQLEKEKWLDITRCTIYCKNRLECPHFRAE